MSAAQFIWFILIGVLFAGYFFLDGFDLGVGMSMNFFARDKQERDVLTFSIGPFWDGNEVWLITAGGAMFAAFPYWYATLFSGYYLILLFILLFLIMRGVSFEFRSRMEIKYQPIWDKIIVLSSAMIPFLFGMLFTSMIQGMPIDANGNIMNPSFWDFVNPLSVVGGVALTLLCYIHGLNYIGLKTTGSLRNRAKHFASFCYWVLEVGEVIFAILLATQTDFFRVHPLATSINLCLIVLFTIIGQAGVFRDNEKLAFFASGLTNVSLVSLIFCGLFPRLMPSTLGHDLLISNASSNPYTLNTMLIVVVCILPFVLAYTIWSYYIFRKRIKTTDVQHGGY